MVWSIFYSSERVIGLLTTALSLFATLPPLCIPHFLMGALNCMVSWLWVRGRTCMLLLLSSGSSWVFSFVSGMAMFKREGHWLLVCLSLLFTIPCNLHPTSCHNCTTLLSWLWVRSQCDLAAG